MSGDTMAGADGTTREPELAAGAVRQCFALLAGERRTLWAGLTGLSLVASAAEALGAALIFVLIGLITDPAAPVELPVVGDVRLLFADVPDDVLIVRTALAIGGFFVVRAMLLVLQSYAQHRVAYHAGARLSSRLMAAYLRQPYAYHLQRDSSILVRNALSSVTQIVGQVVLPATKLVAEIFMMVGLLAVLVTVAPGASVLAVLVLGPATWITLRLVKARQKSYGRIATDAAKDSLQELQQSLHGIREVKLSGSAEVFIQRFSSSRSRDAEARYRQATLAQMSSVQIETVLILFIVIFLVLTVVVEGGAGGSLPVLSLFAYVGTRLKPSVQKVVSAVNSLRFASPAIADINQDLIDGAALPAASADGTAGLPALTHELRAERVTFHYPNADEPAIRDVTISIRRGEVVGVCGPTGGGKSTLVDLLSGLLAPTAGTVTVDGVPIHQDLPSWYAQLGVVSQSVFLFNDTLRQNIALGLRPEDVSEPQLEWAIELAQLREFVRSLPDGLDTHVGERGTRLSGGQRQRVAIARALYSNPSVLVFDEGTAALDNSTEAELIAALERLRGNLTIISVAHRLTTVRRCDRILLVEGGQVVDEGAFEDLVQRNPRFRAMSSADVAAPTGPVRSTT